MEGRTIMSCPEAMEEETSFSMMETESCSCVPSERHQSGSRQMSVLLSMNQPNFAGVLLAYRVSYSAVSHVVKDMGVRIKETPKLGGREKSINSQFTM